MMTETRGRTASPPARPAVRKGQRVLVVDDEPAMLRALRINLRVRKYDDTGPLPVRVRVGRCEIDLAAHTALDGATTVRLTPTQWRLLEILLRHPGQLVGTQRLLTEIWGPGYERYTHYLRFHMAGLRRK